MTPQIRQELALRRRARRRARASLPSREDSRAGRWLLAAILAPALLLSLIGGSAAVYASVRYNDFTSEVVPPEELLAEQSLGGARIYDRHGTLLYEFVDEFGGLRRPVPLSEMSEWVLLATVSTEDATFWENNGLNFRGLARAALENFAPTSAGGEWLEGSGGSSITQQLAKNVYIPREERTERSVERKLKETVIALELTERYSKEQILEWYLNTISYGGIYVGIEAAAEGYFGKSASELTLAEASLLAGIPQQPALYNPISNPDLAFTRQQQVLDLMVHHGAITQQQAEAAVREELVFRNRRFDIEAPHFVLGPVAREIKQRFGDRALYDDGLEVYTTIDLHLQHEAERVIEHWVSEFEEQANGHNGALVAMEPKTGQILAYVGSRDYFRADIAGRNDNASSLNSPGSTLKPFTYMATFMEGWSTGTGMVDAPVEWEDPENDEDEVFKPRNPSGNYQGIITVDKALGNSLNVPAFKAILYAGVADTVSLLKQVGLTTLDNPGGYGPALTLGGVDVTLLDLTYAYSVLANNGVMRGQETFDDREGDERELDPVALLRVQDPDGNVLYEFDQPAEEQVVAPSYAYMVTSILSDGQNQCITFGCNALGLQDRPSAQKTGTSEPYEDSRDIGDTWTFGYTPDLVAGVWAGNADNSPMVNIVSTSISWRAWRDFMNYAHEYLEVEPSEFERPEGVVEREVCWPSGKLPTDACPQRGRYTALFSEDALSGDSDDLERMEDDWWRIVGGSARLVIPAEDGGNTSVMRQWASRAGVWLSTSSVASRGGDDRRSGSEGRGGSDRDAAASRPPRQVTISQPAPNTAVSGTVQIVGQASSPDFDSYVVQWGSGANPSNWTFIGGSARPISGGVLASWSTAGLPDGRYTVRLTVRDNSLPDLHYSVPVIVGHGGGAAVAAPPSGGSQSTSGSDSPPRAQAPPSGTSADAEGGQGGGGHAVFITSPPSGGRVSGVVTIRGTAAAPNFSQWTLELGSGASPSSWTMLQSASSPAANRPLFAWSTTSVPDGEYTLRLTAHGGGSVSRSTVVVTVDNDG